MMGQFTDEEQKALAEQVDKLHAKAESEMPFADKSRTPLNSPFNEKTGYKEDISTRLEILGEAADATGGIRNSIYGEPRDNLGVQAKLIEAYLHGRIHAQGSEFRVAAEDVAIINTLIKIGRIATGKYHRDNYVDGSAYMAIAGELGDKRIKQVFPEDTDK